MEIPGCSRLRRFPNGQLPLSLVLPDGPRGFHPSDLQLYDLLIDPVDLLPQLLDLHAKNLLFLHTSREAHLCFTAIATSYVQKITGVAVHKKVCCLLSLRRNRYFSQYLQLLSSYGKIPHLTLGEQ